MRPILFLDIDGVLNDHSFDPDAESTTLKPACVRAFNRILRTAEPMVIVSSAWRYMVFGETMTWPGFCYMLRTHGVDKAISQLIGGTTRADTMVEVLREGKGGEREWVSIPEPNERGEQVRDWVRESESFWTGHWKQYPRLDGKASEPIRYVVVDDLDLGFTAGDHPFVQTDGAVGLTEADADRVIEMLAVGH